MTRPPAGPSLAAWQQQVGAALLAAPVGGPATPPADGTGTAMPDTPAARSGWAVTTSLHHQWRIFRLGSLAPLTLALLGDQAEVVVSAYLTAQPGSTLYAATDGERFLRFAAAAVPATSHLEAITALEADFITVRGPAEMEPAAPADRLIRSRRSSVRTTGVDPHRLLLWLAGRGPRPDHEPHGLPILVAPHLPAWVRVATEDEVRVWELLEEGLPADRLPGDCRPAARTLRAAGALLGPPVEPLTLDAPPVDAPTVGP